MKVPDPRRLKSGSYFIQLRLNGVSVPVTAATAAECKVQAQLIKAEYRAGKKRISADKATLTAAIDSYINKRSNILSPLTIRGYRIIQKNRFQSVMKREIRKIDWQEAINREAELCSPKTLKNAWGFIRSVVKEATGEYPPAVKLPQLMPSNRTYLTPDQIKVFVAGVKDTKYAVPALLALSSLRASEIEALRWEDLPEDPKFIRVSGAVVLDEHNNRVVKASNKNASSARNVPVMIPELSAAIKRDRKERGPVMPYTQNSLRYGLEKVCKANGLPVIGIHELRHSYASLAYFLRIPERIAMEIGGWADAATMHRIYTHIAQTDIQNYQTAMMDFYQNANENANGQEKIQ